MLVYYFTNLRGENSIATKSLSSFNSSLLAWATWIIARLGGWSGYKSQKPPGITTLSRGLEQFESTFFGWKLALGLLVCTP
jgi:hypothetical protein